MLALFQSVEPGGSPHCGAMARGGLAAEVFPASGFAYACSIFVCGDLAGRMMDPAVRARRLRRSPTEGTPLGVSVDSRCRGFACACSIFVCGALAGRMRKGGDSADASGRLFFVSQKNARRGRLGGAIFRVGAVFQIDQSRGMCFSQQTVRVFSSHKLACTSPMCAQPIISMHRRDWPIPPPIVRGSFPSSSILWKGKARR